MKTKSEILEDLHKSCTKSSENASDIARKIAYGGAAVCWFFKGPKLNFPTLILISLGLLSIFFMLDLMQYYLRWRLDSDLYDKIEIDSISPEKTMKEDIRIQRILDRIFSFKLLALFLAFVFIGTEIIGKILIQ
jgi:hypothetical protein